MKIKISKIRFNKILKEEVDKYKKIENLKKDKKLIQETLLKMESASSQEEIDELWGGIKNLVNKGAKSAWSGAKNIGREVGDSIKGAGQDVANIWNDASQSVNKGVENVKQAYQQGEEKASNEKAQAQVSKVWNQIKATQKQLNGLNSQYLNMTGKPFNAKAVAGPAKNKQQPQQAQSKSVPPPPPQQQRKSVPPPPPQRKAAE